MTLSLFQMETVLKTGNKPAELCVVTWTQMPIVGLIWTPRLIAEHIWEREEMDEQKPGWLTITSEHSYRGCPLPKYASTLSIDFEEGGVKLVMCHAGVRHVAKFQTHTYTHLRPEWKKIFIFSSQGPYPGFSDIIVRSPSVDVNRRYIHFRGQYFNKFSGSVIGFETKFTFSKSNNILRVETIVGIDGTQTVVGRRFMMRPGNSCEDFSRYLFLLRLLRLELLC